MDWEYESTDYEIGKVYSFDQYDIVTKKYFVIRFYLFREEEITYRIAQMVEIMEFMELSRDMAEVARFFKELNQFKTSVMEQMTKPFYMLLPIIEKYICKCGAKLIRCTQNLAECYSYDMEKKIYIKKELQRDSELEQLITKKSGSIVQWDIWGEDEYACLLSGNIMHNAYALYGKCDKMSNAKDDNKLLIDDLKLYLENGLMRDEIQYESEHDKMTGLYNKGKYLARLKEEYQALDSIAIYNFDVNYLKKINDTLGHEAGDRLLKRAADSIKNVCTQDNIHGYRMGGDEYLMIVANEDRAFADRLLQAWEESLKQLNQAAGDFECIIAVGMVYGEKGYLFEDLMKESDELMYEDKKKKKKPGEEIR